MRLAEFPQIERPMLRRGQIGTQRPPPPPTRFERFPQPFIGVKLIHKALGLPLFWRQVELEVHDSSHDALLALEIQGLSLVLLTRGDSFVDAHGAFAGMV